MDSAHHDYTQRHYAPRAQDYLHSAVHASGEDLDRIEQLAETLRPARVLDLGCGGGHVAYRVATYAGSVVAFDLTEAMLEVVRETAAARGLGNIATRRGPAEHLPFADAAFDLVISRFSAHHWPDMPAGLREARRVLAPGGQALFVDSIAPSVPLLDTHLQAVELLRDPSHVRNYRAEEWHTALAQAGLGVIGLTRHRLRMEFAGWVARTRTPAMHEAALLALQNGAAEPVRRYYEIGDDGSWTLDVLSLSAA